MNLCGISSKFLTPIAISFAKKLIDVSIDNLVIGGMISAAAGLSCGQLLCSGAANALSGGCGCEPADTTHDQKIPTYIKIGSNIIEVKSGETYTVTATGIIVVTE